MNYIRNNVTLQTLVNGEYGRKIAYTDVEEITEDNVVAVLGETISVFNFNKPIIKYLWRYKNGDQPALYRTKTVRDDVNNPVVENHAWEIVQFKNGQMNGEPIQIVSLVKDDAVNQAVDTFNDYCRDAFKHARDITCGEWTSAVGTGFKAVQRVKGKDTPFRIVVPTPMNTYIVYNRNTGETMMSVQELKDTEGERYFQCFSETHEYIIKNSKLVALDVLEDGTEVYSRLHAFRGIPIVEYPNNSERISDIELVITMLDAINEMQSNRMDGIAQFVQSFMKFINCEIDREKFLEMKSLGAITVKSNNGADNKADVDIMSQELNQSESQIAKEDLIENVWSILGIPSKQNGSDGGSTQGAVELRSGWDFSKQRAKLKDPYIKEAEKKLDLVILNVIRQAKGVNECSLVSRQFDVQINHSPTDNMLVKVQALQLLLTMGIHPLIAIRTVGLWGDAEKVFIQSKQYLQVLYKTIDEIEDKEEQEARAKQILDESGILNDGNAN